MKIKFVGAIEHITGSCSWLRSDSGIQFLVDCGMYQGSPETAIRNKREFPFDPEEISFVLLTHAHMDHCGLIPKLYREGFRGKVYCTAATAKLAEIGWLDTVKIGGISGEQLYTEAAVKKVNFVKIDENPNFYWEKSILVAHNIWATFRRSSHILGAAAISVSWKKGERSMSMCFSGDIGNNTKKLSYLPMMKPNKYPFPRTQYLLVESTYGGRIREEANKCPKNRQHALWQTLTNTRARGGKVVVPAFSIHRSQEILIDLIATIRNHDAGGESWRILCHSPMTKRVCKVYSEELPRTKQTKDHEDEYLYLRDDFARYISGQSDELEKPEDAMKQLFESGGYEFMHKHKVDVRPRDDDDKVEDADDYNIIVASSGMCAAGPICGYLEKYDGDSANTIIITGYQSTKEGGEILKRTKTTDEAEERYAEVVDLSAYYSAHADQEVLLDYIFNVGGVDDSKLKIPATVFINHGGNIESKRMLKSAVEKQAKKKKRQRKVEKVLIAESGQWFDLHTGKYVEITLQDVMRELGEIRGHLRAHDRLLAKLAESKPQTKKANRKKSQTKSFAKES